MRGNRSNTMTEKTEPESAAVPPRAEVSWKAAEYGYVEKSVLWYAVVGLTALILVAVALWQKNFFFAVFVVIAAAVFIAFGKQRPPVVEFRVSGEGVSVGKRSFSYDRLESFAVRSRPNRLDEIILKQKTYVNPYLRLPADAKSARDARLLLRAALPEVEYQESLIDILSEWVGL